MTQWGGHSCPPLLNLIFGGPCGSREVKGRCRAIESKSKAADMLCPERSRRECPRHANLYPAGRPSTSVTCSIRWGRITIPAMRFSAKSLAVLTLCELALGASFAQQQIQDAESPAASTEVRHQQVHR